MSAARLRCNFIKLINESHHFEKKEICVESSECWLHLRMWGTLSFKFSKIVSILAVNDTLIVIMA